MSEREYEFVQYRKDGRVAYVTFNRPEVLNAMHAPMHAELSEVWQNFKDDDEVWVAIVTGAGDRAFSAGNDLKYTNDHTLEKLQAKGHGPGGYGGMTFEFDCTKPIIAAVNGYALGGGFEIALACDIVVAAENAVFALPEVRLGLIAGAGGIHRLGQKAASNVAMSILMTGRRVTAAEAYRYGLVNEVVPSDELMASAKRWADQIIECSPIAVRLTKQAFLSGAYISADEAIANDRRSILPLVVGSQDSKEGPLAFVEKRSPVWSGR